MKKIVVLLLVFSLLSLTSCGLSQKKEDTAFTVADICAIANRAVPTTVITEMSLTTEKDTLNGFYTTATNGTDAVFTFNYERFATPEESLESGKSNRLVEVKGVVNYRDGVYYGVVTVDDETYLDGVYTPEEDLLTPGTGTAFDLKFNVDESLLADATVSEDGYSVTAKVSKENLVKLIGTDLNSTGDAGIIIETNGKNLTFVTVSCTTANGKLVLRSSFTNTIQDLFPEPEESK